MRAMKRFPQLDPGARRLQRDPRRQHGLVTILARVFGVAALSVLSGCGNEEGVPAPNQPPETSITSSVPGEGNSVHHMVTIEYSARDIDGTVFNYEYLVHTYPRTVDSIDDIVVPTPADDDPRWEPTNLPRAELVLTADTLRADPRGDIGDGRFDRWHTFFVRAIDNEGAKDPSPPWRTFNTFTTAPQMYFLEPVVQSLTTELPVTFALQWDGIDDGLSNTTRDPLDVRWVLLPAVLDASDQPVGFPDALYDLPENEWGPWHRFNEFDGSGREARFFDVIDTEGDSTFVLAIQGRDDAGAVTPQFKSDVLNDNNMAILKLRSDLPRGPELTLRACVSPSQPCEPPHLLGSWDFRGDNAPAEVVMAAGVDTVVVRWVRMGTVDYGGRPGEYRFGWNVQNPEDEAEWSEWGIFFGAPAFVLNDTIEKFQLQGRDNLDQITTATLFFQRP